ncbi:hypothetical protein P3L10_018420 [Capsicum annuum]
MGEKVDTSVNQIKGPRTFRLSEQNYHKIESLLLIERSFSRFAQLYIYDTENEVNNRIHAISRDESSKKIHFEIISDVKKMLDENNMLAKSFRMARDRFQKNRNSNLCFRLIGKRDSDGRRYNLPSVLEVAALVVGDFEPTKSERDIVIETQFGQLQRINELNTSYLDLQYPQLLPYSEDG